MTSPSTRSTSLSPPSWRDLPPEAKLALLLRLREKREEQERKNRHDFSRYVDDPVAFTTGPLGEHLTPELEAILESVRDNVITIAQSANAVGKTFVAARAAVWFYKVFRDAQVYTAAAPPEGNLKKLLWGEIGGLVQSKPVIFAEDTITGMQIARSPQSFIAGVTIPASGKAHEREAKFSGKHAPHLLFILDEGDAIPDEVYAGIESCMSGGHARLLVMFNPRAEAGHAYRLARDGRAKVIKLTAFDHPNVTTGRDEIPGAVTRDTTARRIVEWCRHLQPDERPDAECFELPRFLVDAVGHDLQGQPLPPLKAGWYHVDQPAFWYMVLGEYPQQGTNQLISREWVGRARARWDAYVSEHGENPPTGVLPIMGLDVAELGADSNAACFRYGGWVARLKTWGGVDLVQTGARAAELAWERKATVVNVDATGVGAGVAPHLEQASCPAQGIKVASAPTWSTELGDFGTLRDQLWWEVREWLRTDPGAMLPPDDRLVEELLVPTYEINRQGKVKAMDKKTMRELLKRSPDLADALCLTFAPTPEPEFY